MQIIEINTARDQWINREEVLEKIRLAASDVDLVLDFMNEGPSLYGLGMVSSIMEICQAIGRDPKSIKLMSLYNTLETVPFERLDWVPYSWMWNEAASLVHHSHVVPTASAFAFFMNRPTVPRCAIMYDLYHDYHDYSLLSLMLTYDCTDTWLGRYGPPYYAVEDWCNDLSAFYQWWKNPPVSSLDGAVWQSIDIFEVYRNCQSLLRFYDRFFIEIVAETYTVGETFFCTEKIVRPIAAGKPFLVFGPQNYLANLRRMGFETFADCWDESYDSQSGLTRWQSMKRCMDAVISDPTTISRAYEISQRNQKHLIETLPEIKYKLVDQSYRKSL